MNEPKPEKSDYDAKLRDLEEYYRKHDPPICSGVQNEKEEKKCSEPYSPSPYWQEHYPRPS